MSTIDVLWLAYLNRDIDDSGTDDSVNLTINVDHYNQTFRLHLTGAQKADLVEFLKSL